MLKYLKLNLLFLFVVSITQLLFKFKFVDVFKKNSFA